MNVSVSFRRVFLLSACLTVFSLNSFAYMSNSSPSQDQRYFKEIALKWGNLANQPNSENNSPAVLKAGIAAYRDVYRLGAGDSLILNSQDLDLSSLNSLTENSVSTRHQVDLQVDRNGDITVPSFGTFNVTGLTTSQVENMLVEMARYYLHEPKMYLTLKSTRPFSIYITGEIRHPGPYQILTEQSSGYTPGANSNVDAQDVYSAKIATAVRKAGGILPSSDLEHVTVDNSKSGKHLNLNLKKMILEGDSLQDVLLEPDDVVFIPRCDVNNNKIPEIATSTLSPDKYQVKILGFVNRSNVGAVELDSKSMTVTNALNKINVDPDANLKNIIVLRKEAGQDKYYTLKVDVTKADLALEPDDTVLVTHKRIGAMARQFAQTIIFPASQATFTGVNLRTLAR